MVYRLVSDWISKDGNVHEITVYKYNYSNDTMVRYIKEKDGKIYKGIYTPEFLSTETYYFKN